MPLPAPGLESTLGAPVHPTGLLQTHAPTPAQSSGQRRNSAELALALFEVIRVQDSPVEILEDEDVTRTMPRRLGLSDVIDQQIRRFREQARKGRRLTDGELRDLVGLVIRRPDATEVFFEAGLQLAEGMSLPKAPGRIRRLALARARRRTRRRLRELFGRRIGGFAHGEFAFEGAALPMMQADPRGRACALVTGLSQGILQRYLGAGALVVEQACESRGDTKCRWVLVERSAGVAGRAQATGAEAG